MNNSSKTIARVVTAVLVMATAGSWYSILKPELKTKRDENSGLRRRLEAAVQPGEAFLSAPTLVRTSNKSYLVTIQENRNASAKYKSDLANYLKDIARSEAGAQLQVVYSPSPVLTAKNAVASMFASSAAPFLLGALFLALVRFFAAPVSLALSRLPSARKEEEAFAPTESFTAARSARTQNIHELNFDDLQERANQAFNAQQTARITNLDFQEDSGDDETFISSLEQNATMLKMAEFKKELGKTAAESKDAAL